MSGRDGPSIDASTGAGLLLSLAITAGTRAAEVAFCTVDRTNRNTALCSALVEELARCGVEHVCISPGSRSAPLALAFWNEPGIRVWSHVDERCGGFFALGIAQRSGRPAAVLTTSGTAGANLHPAVAEADEARVPLIVITADRPPELRGRGAGQTVDQLKLYGSMVRWFCELGVHAADDVGLVHFRSTAVRAFAEACAPPPGPVHLNVPLQEPLAPLPADAVSATEPLALEGRGPDRPLTSVVRAPAALDPDVVSSLADLIADNPRGVIVAGRQRDPALSGPAAALAAAAGYPILAEPTSQLRCGDHDLSHVIAQYDAVLRDPPEELRPDLVVRLGDMVTSKAARQWLGSDPGPRQVVVDPDGAWNEPSSRAEQMLRVDPPAFCRALAAKLDRAREPDWLDGWKALARAADAAIDDFLDSLGDELFEPRVHRAMGRLLPAESTIYVASSMPVRDLETFLPTLEQPLFFVSNRGANGIDGLVSSGLGAAAVASGRTYLLTGDLGLYHDMNGLLAVGRCAVEATIVVLNNGGGGIFDFLPIAAHRDGYEELFATPTGLDFEKVAALYGLRFTRLGSYDQLAEALARPGLVEVPLDRQRNVELHRELFAQTAAAVREAGGVSTG
jgi:2-succinyl-5-enolpyruvyl-6-hydroxy-3-cyclohexene-1-carboxylate synthase